MFISETSILFRKQFVNKYCFLFEEFAAFGFESERLTNCGDLIEIIYDK